MVIPPDGPSKLRRIRAETMQLVRDIESWNQNRTDEDPFDLGAELVMVQLCDQGLAAAANGDAEEYARVANDLVEAAQRAASK